MLKTKYYPNDHYTVIFNTQTGFFARIEDSGYDEPFWSPSGPELIDISITNWCDKECSTCYRSSNKSGMHMDLSDYEMIISQARSLGTLQVALGGGNPNQHPNFEQLLKVTHENGIVPSYTTNGRGLTNSILDISKSVCGAVAVSAYEPFDEFIPVIYRLLENKVRTNIHFVLSSTSIELAIRWLKNPQKFLNKINALIFLNYKPIGRLNISNQPLKYSERLKEFFGLIESQKFPFKIGFDSCLVSGIASLTNFPSAYYDFCESGRFSMFISENCMAYPCSFMEPCNSGIKINDSNLIDIWKNSKPFIDIRNKISENNCSKCLYENKCKGGCPIFPEINICPEKTMDKHSIRSNP